MSARATRVAAAGIVIVCLGGFFLRWSAARRLDSAESLKAASRIDYYEFGLSLRELGVLGWSGRACAFRGPLYPSLLSAVESYRSDRRPRTPALQALMNALEAPVAAAAALELFSPAAGLAAAAMTAFRPGMNSPPAGCKIETIFGLLMCLVAWALVRWSRTPTWGATFLLAFAVGVSLLCRAVLFAFPLVLAGSILAGWLPSPGRGKLWALVVAPYLVLGPWVLRNAVQFGRFIPFEDGAAAINLYAASIGFIANSDSGPYQDILAVESDPRGALAAAPAEHMRALARRNIATSPLSYAASCGRRLLYVFRLHPWLLLLAFAGALRHRSSPAVRALSMLCLYYVLVHLPMTMVPRYLEPLLPVLMVLAAGLVAERPLASFSPAGSDPWRRAAPAILLLCLAPPYLLAVERLAAEVLLTHVPCRLPPTPLTGYHCGAQLLSRGKREEASARWREALSALADDPAEPTLLRARIEGELIAAGDIGALVSQSAGCSSLAALRYPDEVQKAALRFQDAGRIAEALRLYDAILVCHPDDPRHLSDRAVAHSLNGRQDLALRDLRRALEISPGDARSSYNLGTLLEKRGRRKDALAVYKRAQETFHLQDQPTEKLPMMVLAMISQRIRELQLGPAQK